MKTDFKQIKAAALASIDSVLSRWAPGGKRKGHEYLALNPRRSDSKPGSFSINLNTGAWADFATDDKGGDLVALVAYLENLKQGEAAKLLADFLGLNLEKSNSPERATSPRKEVSNTSAPPASKKPEWRALYPVPKDAPEPPKIHSTHGKPSMQWEYRDTAGNLLCLVYRFDPNGASARKQFCPLTWCESADGTRREWRWQGLPDPRPLYHSDQIMARGADAPVIVCEGEKAADAAGVLFPDAVAVTMLNGAQSPHKTDWRSLAGRTVWLWPDNDSAGLKCMAAVADLVGGIGASEVRQIDLAAFAKTPGFDETGLPILTAGTALPEKWDAADAVKDGWTAGHVNLLRASPKFFQAVDATPPAAAKKPASNAPTEPENPQRRFHTNADGVWYFGKNETGTDAPPLWICSKLEITAVTRDARNEAWGRLLEFDDLDNTHHAWAMPMELLKGDGAECRGVLLSMGLRMSTMTKARNLLTQYIQTAPAEQRARCVERTGWHGTVFVMPERTIGETDERILLQSVVSTDSTFKQRGKLADWQAHVATLCAGNSRLVFAVSAAFAAPLLDVMGMDSCGLHYRGISTIGKTTALRVAASVWGGAEYVQSWRATDNGLEALAAQHSDCLLPLDELSQVDPKVAGDAMYMLGNGSGKVRATRTGTSRAVATWRLIFLSSGEHGLSEHMAMAGKKPKAGQEVRFLDIPADAGAGYGMFENLHHYAGGGVFSMAFREASSKYYGTAAPAFLQKLVQHRKDWAATAVKRGQREFKAAHVPTNAGGQVERAALRFALVGVAGEQATEWEITGWQPGEAMAAAAICFKAWLGQRGSAGNLEEAQMLAQVRRFFELHGEARFSDWERPASDTSQHPPRTMNRAGYRKHSDTLDATGCKILLEEWDEKQNQKTIRETEYYVFPETFKTEVCQGFDYRAVCKLLVKLGALMPDGKGYTRKERLPGGEGNVHVFRITSKLLEDGEEHENA